MSVIIPGSFDPVTLGHLELIRRAAREFDEVYVVIFVNPEKSYTFSLDDRMKMLMLSTDELENVIVSYSDGLVIDYMREHGIEKIVKGYRNGVDLEYERRQAEWNLSHGGFETVFYEAGSGMKSISSTLARDLIKSGAELSSVLHPKVISFLENH